MQVVKFVIQLYQYEFENVSLNRELFQLHIYSSQHDIDVDVYNGVVTSRSPR